MRRKINRGQKILTIQSLNLLDSSTLHYMTFGSKIWINPNSFSH